MEKQASIKNLQRYRNNLEYVIELEKEEIKKSQNRINRLQKLVSDAVELICPENWVITEREVDYIMIRVDSVNAEIKSDGILLSYWSERKGRELVRAIGLPDEVKISAMDREKNGNDFHQLLVDHLANELKKNNIFKLLLG